MTMDSRTTTTTLCIFFVSLALLSSSPAMSDDGTTPTVYQVLQEYGFPVGILPEGVTSYELDRSTGKFTVYLDETCSFTIDGYNIRYKSKVTGVISYQRLTDLSGVQVKVLFFWLSIGEVTLDGDELDFSVGIASADFHVDNFYESPQCGCGFDCVNAVGDGIGMYGSGSKFNWRRLFYPS
ncbi:uncharacterized protein At5g01610-like [Coffea eugenioides]|uniref:Uncharacterized protein At5g01610-like n=1 Tax=Coffea arabica TaxID=13443 RepID=A0A6P6V7I6_COFAR|nr:uncharacterized protein At5g01610-like [Coffea arabica]XP_027098954.1 uncharacterized protein At5g01610-like [Coffea arabica]XP_027098960.1 uncharacterized protein At5g01610-like [Coffea arabica]XP_027148028.1 uncharacterized protein At5g01610-like [Coffea eugenioides]XP_027148033.1 uncharacterized protein At5g01610-like [Coffea eugenioides]